MTEPRESAAGLSAAAVALRDVHDQIIRDLGGDAYASISASWTGEDGKMRTLSYSTVESKEDEDDA